MTSLRIAIVGLSVECLIESPLKTHLADMQIYRGQDMIDANLWMVRGVVQRLAEEEFAEAVPLMWATALPGGSLTADNYAALRKETIDLLRANGPFDGVVMVNHGALEVDGIKVHPDSDFLKAVREVVGPDVPVAASLDLHGHISPGFVENITVIGALRTAPHRDDREAGYRATDQLLRVLHTGIKPRIAAVRVPILIAGEAAVTTTEPGASLYDSLDIYDARPGILEANIFVGFAFNDVPWGGMAAVVTSEGDEELARATAHQLANDIWQKRHDFVLRMETASVADGLTRLTEASNGQIFVSDSGDNTTAGAPGDLTGVLQAVLNLESRPKAVVAGITAPGLVQQALDAGIGSSIEVVLGAEHVSSVGTRMRVKGEVINGGPELHLSGFQPYRSVEAAWAAIRFGDVVATFHACPIGITTPEHFDSMGLNRSDFNVFVVKLGYLHPRLEDIASRHILLLSEGTVSLDLENRDWQHVQRPAIPADSNFDWSAARSTYTG
ncbi:M81 family metallopeptidase [Brucella sp. BE17]|uniref:M81 family metallopeptidase n=1 Tax=Brucella sp. BE17 TaxID=3142977 RepID=UPI0031BAD7F8